MERLLVTAVVICHVADSRLLYRILYEHSGTNPYKPTVGVGTREKFCRSQLREASVAFFSIRLPLDYRPPSVITASLATDSNISCVTSVCDRIRISAPLPRLSISPTDLGTRPKRGKCPSSGRGLPWPTATLLPPLPAPNFVCDSALSRRGKQQGYSLFEFRDRVLSGRKESGGSSWNKLVQQALSSPVSRINNGSSAGTLPSGDTPLPSFFVVFLISEHATPDQPSPSTTFFFSFTCFCDPQFRTDPFSFRSSSSVVSFFTINFSGHNGVGQTSCQVPFAP